MNRMRRWLWWGINGLCAVVFVLAVALCVRQMFQMDALTVNTSPLYTHVSSSPYRLRIQAREYQPKWNLNHVTMYDHWSYGPFTYSQMPHRQRGSHSFAFESTSSYAEVIIPMWLILVLSFAPPAASWIIARRRRQGATGHPLCHACGYDLHGCASNVCPECGEVISENEQ